METYEEKGSIHPTIDVCGKQKSVAVELTTTSKSRSIGFSEPKSGLSRHIRPIPKSETIARTSDNHHYTFPCPFCLRSEIIYTSKRQLKKNNKLGVKCWKCSNCEKYFTQSQFWHMKKDDYVISIFVDVIRENPTASLTEIRKLMVVKNENARIGKTCASVWRKKYRKGKLFEGYLPNSKFNKINRPNRTFIPKIVTYRLRSRTVTRFYGAK